MSDCVSVLFLIDMRFKLIARHFSTLSQPSDDQFAGIPGGAAWYPVDLKTVAG
jgi:hypothetical protein